MPKLLDATISGAVNRVTDPLSIGKTPLYVAAQAKYVAGPDFAGSYTLATDTTATPSKVRVTITDTGPSIVSGKVRVMGYANPSGDIEYEDLDISAGAGAYDTTMLFDEVSAALGGVFSWGVVTLGGGSDELIRAEWFEFPYTTYTLANAVSASGADPINVTVVDTTGSITVGEVRIQGIAGGVAAFENIDISAGAGVYPSALNYTEITGVATVGVATLGGGGDETVLVEWDADGADVVAVTNLVNQATLDLVVPEDLVETAVEFDVYLQTSLDEGGTWADIANFHFTGFDLTKIHAVVGTTALAANITPTEGTIADNTILSGLIGDKLRVRYKTVSDIRAAEITVNVAVH